MEQFEILDQKGNIISVECPVEVAERVEHDSGMIEEIVKYASGSIMTSADEDCNDSKDNQEIETDPNDEDVDVEIKPAERAVWTPAPTRLLIKQMYIHLKKVGRSPLLKTKRQLWHFLSERLREKGYTFSHESIENKWKGLERQYKKVPENGTFHVGFPYKKEMDEIRDSLNSSQSMATNTEDEATIDNLDFSLSGEDVSDKRLLFRRRSNALECHREERTVWTHIPTVLLIESMKKNFRKVGKTSAIKTKRQLWQIMHEELKEQGYIFSVDSIENKWKGLERQYRKAVQTNKQGIFRRATFAYEKEFKEIFKYKKSKPSFPQCLLSSTGEDVYKTNMEDTCSNDQVVQQQTGLHPEKDQSIVLRRLAAYEKRTAAIERRNNLIEQLLDKFPQ